MVIPKWLQTEAAKLSEYAQQRDLKALKNQVFEVCYNLTFDERRYIANFFRRIAAGESAEPTVDEAQALMRAANDERFRDVAERLERDHGENLFNEIIQRAEARCRQ